MPLLGNSMRQPERFAKRSNEQDVLLLWGVVAIVALQFMLGLYAVALNALFYTQYGPFYDSLSYDNALARMQLNARSDGTLAALSRAIYSDTVAHPLSKVIYSNTVAYPWILFAPFARITIASRAIGVWIQIFAAIWMQLAMFFYFMKIKGRTWADSFTFSAAFVLIAAAFDSNGGLSDFRMDLLQYLLYATVLAIFLIARSRQTLGWWALLGLASGLLCLGRATSLVYIVPIFGVCSTVDLIANAQNRRQVLLNWLLVGAVAATAAGWFFVSNFRHLYFYYVVWNQDANAHLSLSESVGHLGFAMHHIGIPLLFVLVLIALHTGAQSLRRCGTGLKKRLNWPPLLFSTVPLGYLVLSGSGLNPFVSIVGVSGIMLFLLEPIDSSQILPPQPLSVWLSAALLFAGCLNAVGGIYKHSRDVPNWLPRQEGVRDVVQTMTNIAVHADGRRYLSYAFIYTGALNEAVIFNTMYFDEHIAFDKDRAAKIAGSHLVGIKLGNDVSTAVEWSMLAGATDDEKIANIVRSANEGVYFLLAPADGTELPMHVYGNRFAVEINRRLRVSGEWERIAGPITISPIENAVVLRNMRRATKSD